MLRSAVLKQILLDNRDVRYIKINWRGKVLWVTDIRFDFSTRNRFILSSQEHLPERKFICNTIMSYLTNFGDTHKILLESPDKERYLSLESDFTLNTKEKILELNVQKPEKVNPTFVLKRNRRPSAYVQ